MALSVGIHVGHDASCAVVRGGVLVAAMQQERSSRRKHDGPGVLSNALPVAACLDAIGACVDDVDVIVSSFQAASPGGYGLHLPLIQPQFSLFDPTAENHYVASHHLAHAACGTGQSPFGDCAVLVCDLAGSSTLDGQDFLLPFADWHAEITTQRAMAPVRTECLSIFSATDGTLELTEREFVIPHNSPGSFVQSVASLYENVSFRLFGRRNAHGATMALAAYGPQSTDHASGTPIASDIVTVGPDDDVMFHNDWQHRLAWDNSEDWRAALASACQQAAEMALLAYARRASRLTGRAYLAVSGGTFLNILANTRISSSGLFADVYVPSAPHDAGIAVGCAHLGAKLLSEPTRRGQPSSDRLGATYSRDELEDSIERWSHLVESHALTTDDVLKAILNGEIVARWFGRSEFGPRALGGRSLLASPAFAVTKSTLNRIKGRQEWRPVAPVVLAERAVDFFDGPSASPYMSFAHTVRAEHREALPALSHPDGSTRAQTLAREDDPWLYDLLHAVGLISGYPIVVNTSLNGPDEPIVETPGQALAFFLAHPDVDVLCLEDALVQRRVTPNVEWEQEAWLVLGRGVVFHMVRAVEAPRCFLTCGSRTVQLSDHAGDLARRLAEPTPAASFFGAARAINTDVASECLALLSGGYVEVIDTDV